MTPGVSPGLCHVIKSLIGNIALSFMFHCMNLVNSIFWIWLLMCFYFSQSMFGKALLFRKEVAIGPTTVMWLE